MATKGGKSTVYRVRMLRDDVKRYHLMRFKQRLDLTSLVKPTLGRLEMENESSEVQPTHGEGSEYGKKRRDDARLRRRGYDVRTPTVEDQPWELKEAKKDGKKYHGRKEGGVNTSSSYFMLCQCSDGAFEAHPINSWYDFAPVIKHNTFTAEEAEEKYLMKHKTLNYFSLMVSKKMQTKADEDSGSSRGRLLITDQGGSQWSDESDKEELPEPSRTKGKQHSGRKSKKSAMSTESASDGETTDDGEMESCEVDYISDSSASDQSVGEADKQMADLQQHARDVSGGEDSGDSEEEAELTEEGKELNALIKKQQQVPKATEADQGNIDSSDEQEEAPDAVGRQEAEQSSTEPGKKRPFEEDEPNSLQPDSKRSQVSHESPTAIARHEVVHYLQRKPIYTKELVRKFCKKKPDMTRPQVVSSLEKIISTLSVEKTKRDDKVYLCLKS